MQKAINFKDVVVVSVEWNDYRIHIWYMSKDNAINMVIKMKKVDCNKFFSLILKMGDKTTYYQKN